MTATETGLYEDAVVASIILIIFTVAHVGSGLCGLLLNRIPAPILDQLIDSGTYTNKETGEEKTGINCTEWGIRQTTIGIMLTMCCVYGSKESYLIGFTGILTRITLDLIFELLNRRYWGLLAGYCTLGPVAVVGFIVTALS